MDKHEAITIVATSLLTSCTDDYATRIWDVIGKDVVEDVEECSEAENDDGRFTDGDVALAIGRAVCGRFGIEV